jgi:hypothetical protein
VLGGTERKYLRFDLRPDVAANFHTHPVPSPSQTQGFRCLLTRVANLRPSGRVPFRENLRNNAPLCTCGRTARMGVQPAPRPQPVDPQDNTKPRRRADRQVHALTEIRTNDPCVRAATYTVSGHAPNAYLFLLPAFAFQVSGTL